MSAHNSNSPALSQNDPIGTIPPLPTNRYHLEQLLQDVSKVIEAGEELFTAHRYERHVMEEDVLAWRKNCCRMVYTRRLQENDLLKWQVENGLLECPENGYRPLEANRGYASDMRVHPTMEIVSYLYHTEETATLAKELDNISQQCKQLPQLQTFTDPEDLEEFINLGKRITKLWYECDMERLCVLRRRIYQNLDLLDQEATPQPSHSAPEDAAALQNQKIEKFNSSAPGARKAYLSYILATQEKEKDLTDQQAHEFLKEYDFKQLGREEDLYDYELPKVDSWSRQLRTARKALGEEKQEHRYRRPHGRSVVSPDEI